jgi:hypothetical protein
MTLSELLTSDFSLEITAVNEPTLTGNGATGGRFRGSAGFAKLV